MSSDVTIIFLGIKNIIPFDDAICEQYELRKTDNQIACKNHKIDHYWYVNNASRTIVEFMGHKVGEYGAEGSTMLALPMADITYKADKYSEELSKIGLRGTLCLHVEYIEDQ